MNKEGLVKKGRKITNIVTLIALIFNASMFSVFVPEGVSASAPTPSVQTLVSPSNASRISYSDLVFTWDAATDVHAPVEYKFQISTSSAVNTSPGSEFSGVVVYEKNWDSGLITNYIDASDEAMPLIEGKIYYWHVRAEDMTGGSLNRNTWSEVRSFTVVLPAPSLISPLDNSYKNGSVLTMDWSDVAGAVKYEYKSCWDLACANLKWSGFYNISTKSATNVPDGSFYWKVRAYNASNLAGAWSDTRKVNVDTSAPQISNISVVPSVFSPAVGGVTNISFDLSEDSIVVATITDTNPLNGVWYYNILNGEPFTAGSNSVDWYGEDGVGGTVADSTYLVTFNATDAAGNQGATGSYSVVVDSVGPNATTDSYVDATNPTNNNNPIVYGKFDNSIVVLNDVIGAPAVLNYEVRSIQVVFDNGTDIYTKEGNLDYNTGEYSTIDDPDYAFSTTVVPVVTTLPDGIYKVTAYAFDAAGNSTPENIYEESSPLVIDTTKPSEVTNLIVTGKTDTTVSLKWDAVSDTNLGGYKVLILNSDNVLIGTRDVGKSTFATVTGLNPSTSYSFKVVAYDKAMNDSLSPSNTVSDTTNATPVVLAAAVSTTSTGTRGIASNSGVTAPEGAIAGATDEKIDVATENKDEKKDENKNNGFNWWWLLLLTLLAGGGYYYYTQNPNMFKKFGKGSGTPIGS